MINSCVKQTTFELGMRVNALWRENVYHPLRARMAISNPTKVAPLAKGDRMRVGTSPRRKPAMPSFAITFRTQSIVDEYFCPVAGAKPSVCIRDLITSAG